MKNLKGSEPVRFAKTDKMSPSMLKSALQNDRFVFYKKRMTKSGEFGILGMVLLR